MERKITSLSAEGRKVIACVFSEVPFRWGLAKEQALYVLQSDDYARYLLTRACTRSGIEEAFYFVWGLPVSLGDSLFLRQDRICLVKEED